MIAEDIEKKRRLKIASFRIPEWLGYSCDCGLNMDAGSILSISIELNPKMLGNISVTYLCGDCSSMIEMHYVKAAFDSLDINSFLNLDEPPSSPVPYGDLVKSTEHNLL